MKYTDLTKEQREYLDMLVSDFGDPPEGATHFDIRTCTSSSWSKIGAGIWWYWHRSTWYKYAPDQLTVAKLVPIPDKPWYNPQDTALTSKPKIRKIAYDRNAFNQAINWILNNSPYAKEDWRWTLPLDVRRWMQEMIRRYDNGDIDGVSYTGSAGLTLMASWEEEDVLQFELFADVSIGSDRGLYEYDPEDVF